MALRLVYDSSAPPPPPPRDGRYPFAETPLIVAFAAHDALDGVADGLRVSLAATPDLSPDDAYLLLPLRARAELLPAFARGATGRVTAWFDDAWVVQAEVRGARAPCLEIVASWRASSLLDAHEGRVVALAGAGDPVRVINRLPFIEGLAPGGLLDRRGTEAIVARPEYVGVARMGVEELGLGADAVEPTFVWSRRRGARTQVRVALAASDDDSVLALLAPVTLVA